MGFFLSKRKLLKAHERTFYINMLFSNAPAACSQRIKGTSLSKSLQDLWNTMPGPMASCLVVFFSRDAAAELP